MPPPLHALLFRHPRRPCARTPCGVCGGAGLKPPHYPLSTRCVAPAGRAERSVSAERSGSGRQRAAAAPVSTHQGSFPVPGLGLCCAWPALPMLCWRCSSAAYLLPPPLFVSGSLTLSIQAFSGSSRACLLCAHPALGGGCSSAGGRGWQRQQPALRSARLPSPASQRGTQRAPGR